MMTIIPIPALDDNYLWIVVNTIRKSALVVDPGAAEPVLHYLAKHDLDLKGILITHHHSDHVDGVPDLLRQYPHARVIRGVQETESMVVDPTLPTYRVLPIPGHTLDHVAYYTEGVLFCGDTLFGAGCGRLFEGTAEQLFDSLNKIAALPDQTRIYCAHEYTLDNLRFAERVEPNNPFIQQRIQKVTILRKQHQPSLPSVLLEEKQTNPFLRCEVPDVKQSASMYSHRTLKRPVDVFAALRRWKDTF